jgi:hypothetical protein
MFQTVTGSLIILFGVVAIIAAFALFVTALLRWIWGTEQEVVRWSASIQQATPLRRAA